MTGLSNIKYGIEVKSSNQKKWIKCRMGSRQGPQISFGTEREAFDWLIRGGMINGPFRVREIA